MGDYKEYQSELFDEFNEDSLKQRRFKRPLDKHQKITLTISREKLIFSVISVILLYVIFFSLGIERGKTIALRSLKEQNTAAESINETTITETAIEATSNIEEGTAPGIPFADSETIVSQDDIKVEAPPELKEFYTIQAAAYSNLSRAEKEAQKVIAAGNDAIIDSSGKYHLLMIGKFEDKNKANELKKKLAGTYKGCYVRKYTIKD